jgi:sugar phosphate isomerase/epimerase
VAAAGFPAFEAGNLFESYGEAKVRGLLDETGLRVSGAHFGYGEYSDPKRVAAHIAYANAIGLKHLMCSGVADTKTAEGYLQSARVFNEVGKRAADAGLTFNYHNHAWEFTDLGGRNGMDILTAETDPRLVKFNIDVFWVYYAGADPAAFIDQYADRAGYYHFKDGRITTDAAGSRQPKFLELGTGDVDLKAAYAAALRHGASWITAEQDNSDLPAIESATISRRYMKEVLGV